MALGDVPFTSTATDKASFFQDLANHALQSYSLQGLVPASLGVTKPSGGPISSARDLLDTMDGWFGNQRQLRGGPATDAIDTPVGDTYAARRYSFISKEEGVRPWAYDDKTGQRILPGGQGPQGNTTVGVGFNMDDPTARQRFAAALPGISFDDVHDGKLPLNDAQSQTLFNFNAQEAERTVANKLPGVDLNEHQRLALVSMAFNGPGLLNNDLLDAVKNGDRAGAMSAIMSAGGSQERRYREAGLFGGPVNTATLPPFGSPAHAAISSGSATIGSVVDDAMKLQGATANSPLLVDYLKTGGVNLNPAQSAWCAAFVNASLAHHGIAGSGSQVATSFENWGQLVDPSDVTKGDVMVLPRGRTAGALGGHVGMATGNTRVNPDTGNPEIEMIQGNLGHAVKRSWEDPSNVVIRRATS